jgi:hypothetical protein
MNIPHLWPLSTCEETTVIAACGPPNLVDHARVRTALTGFIPMFEYDGLGQVR